ncbi:MAG TPA: CocE/NonD family hydrolase [Pirellulales bacterium]|nr:CocE/NonD family hydrolase [Pirellulales bacterium]
MSIIEDQWRFPSPRPAPRGRGRKNCLRLFESILRAIAIAAVLLIQVICSTAVIAQANPPSKPTAEAVYLRENYTKYEYKIPMRDGVKLFTSVYAPKDDSQPYPILLTRTPYSVKPYGVDVYPNDPGGPLAHYAKERFIFVLEDVRGRYGSEGTFVQMRPQLSVKSGPHDIDESTDAYDTVDWLVRNIPNNNGRVGMMGISYPGFYTAAGMIDSHPALKCASPQAPITDWFVGDDFHHNGAFYLPHAFRWLSRFGQKLEEPTREEPKPFDYKTPDGYEFYLNLGPLGNIDKSLFKGKIEFWDELMSHANYDEFWQSRDLRPHLKNVKSAVMTVGGWYDAEDLFGPLSVFHEVERNNPETTNLLVVGPWAHGGWSSSDGDHLGNVRFFAKTSEFFRNEIELPFLKHFLKDDKKYDLPKAYVFETGTAQWRRFDAWPPKNTREKTLYFRAGGRLSFDPPDEKEGEFDEYVSDPNHPVPYIPNIAISMTREHMLDDQRFASSRPDVAVYQTDVLEDDVTIAGPITARLNVSTTGTDSDWVVKLVDVYSGDYPNPEPNPAGVQMGGYQQLVRGEVMRGKFRNSFEKPEPFEPGKKAKVEWVMPDAYHTFRRGHRIMVQVQSTWFPLVDRNPQKFCDIYRAQADDFQKATERIYHSPRATSAIQVLQFAPPK